MPAQQFDYTVALCIVVTEQNQHEVQPENLNNRYSPQVTVISDCCNRFTTHSQLNGANGEATNKDDVRRSSQDAKQNREINELRREMKMLKMASKANVSKKTKQPRNARKTTKTAKLSKDHTHALRSDHNNVTVGLMDSIPTAPVLVRGSTSNNVAAGQLYLYMGIFDHYSDTVFSTTAYPSGTALCRSVAGCSYGFADNATTYPSTDGLGSFQFNTIPYSVTDSYKTKVNKATLHFSYSGSQTLMSTEVRMYIDYHGDLFRGGWDGYTTPKLVDIYNTVWNHPRVIKVKVESGKVIDYTIPIATAQIADANPVSLADYASQPAWAGATGTVNFCSANVMSLMDQRRDPGLWIRKNSTNTYSVISTPLVYIVSNMTAAGTLSVNTTFDAEYHDESLYSVSKPSLCDTLTASALHTVAMNAHHEATTTPLHPKGLSFKDVLRKATKAEHVAQSVAASPLGEAILTAAMA